MNDVTAKEMVDEAKRNIKELSVGDVKKKCARAERGIASRNSQKPGYV